MENYAIYLRKSRADAEAEARGEGETLARHEKTLLELAKRKKLDIVEIYREIVSGENIAARPQMQRLLSDVSEKKYAGVLVMEIERLARGDTIDQGVVAQAFKESDTCIITPVKSYDPNNEFDEEYFEFGLFMSRREYKTIRRRMNAGRLAAVKEGNYISTNPPYGYRKITPEPKVHTLEIVPQEAEIVRLMYRSYLEGKGSRIIAAELNRLGVQPAKSDQWLYASVKKILRNPVYAGKLTWKAKGAEDEVFDGKHEAIIPYEEYLAVQRKRESSPLAKLKPDKTLKNHYTGLLYCANCGRAMVRRDIPDKHYEHLLCRSPECRGLVVSSRVDIVDELVLQFIEQYMVSLKRLSRSEKSEKKRPDSRKKILQSELTKLQNQKSRLYDYLEQGIYDTATYLTRAKLLADKIDDCKHRMAELEAEQEEHIPAPEMIIRLSHILDCFDSTEDASAKNELLKSVIRKITYAKTVRMCKNRANSDIELHVDFL